MNRSRILALALAPVVLAVPGGALAACEGQGSLICSSGAPRITSPAGLQVSRGGEFVPVDAGTVLRSGDRVLTGDAAARLSLGPSCSAPVAAGALVSITRTGGKTCASVTTPSGAPDGPAVTGAIDAPTGELDRRLVVGVGGAAAAAALALGFGLADGGGNRTPTIVPAATVSAR